MAIFKTKAVGRLGVEFAALDIEALAGYDFWRATSKSVKLYDDARNYTLFSGSGIKFKQSGGTLTDVTAGTIKGLDVAVSGTKMLSVTGLKLKAATIYDYFDANNAKGALNYLLSGNDTITGTKYADKLFGGAGKDTISGGAGSDTLKGDAGNDTLKGDAGNDKLYGGAGNDTLHGGSGNDTLRGDAGNDKLYGGAGRDTLHGGSGKDTFIFKSVKDSTVGASGRDTIKDFSHEAGDRIDLKAIDASTKKAGNQAFKFIEDDAFHKKAGELRYEKKGGKTFVEGDVDGDGKADFSILFDGKIDFVKGDFIL